ncbi:MAG: hypothetical protein JWO31_2669 [Phycisphaerales bacterium]|nr:hypothetical protein [Phycisphaerales bacterium]
MPPRPLARPGVTAAVLSASALAAAGWVVGGCGPSRPPQTVEIERAGSTSVPVDPAWQAWALDHYRGELLTDLRASSDVRFLEPPTVTASRNLETNALDLAVIGALDANELDGTRLRRPYFIAWRRDGSNWRPLDRRIDPGRPAPKDPRAPTERPRTISPTTAPGTVSDPTAAPPPTRAPSDTPNPVPGVVPPDPGTPTIPGTGGPPALPPGRP